MGTHNIAIDYCNEPERFEVANCPPVGCLRTPWLVTNGGLLRVYLAIVGPESEQPQHRLTLTRTESEYTLEAITDLVKSLQKELR